MKNLNRKLPQSIFNITLGFLLLLTCTKAINLPSRFFYNNQEPSAELQIDNETATDEKNSQPTNLKLLGENGGEEIPLEFFSKLDNITDVEEFIDLIEPKDTIDPQYGGKNNKRNVERALVRQPKPANCMPENTVVPLLPLQPSKDPRVFSWPKCTRIKRCNGCCNSELMACEPKVVEAISFELHMICYGQTKPCGKDIAVVEEHKSCECACRIKEKVGEKDCNSLQEYRPDLCRCICTNDEEHKKCLATERKIWNDKNCSCVCRESDNCTTGTVFDSNQCECVDPVYKGAAGPSLEERRRLIVKAVAVDPDNSTIYDAY